MSSDIKVSVVMPVYNVEKYIDECLGSVIKQTLTDIEIICVDDGSTDKSLKIINGYAKQDPRILVISQKNINAGAARNNGFKYARGKYIIFLDADDFYEKQLLEKMYREAEKVSAEVVVVDSDVYSDVDKRFDGGWAFERSRIPKKEVFTGLEVERIFDTFIGWPWDKLFKIDFLKKNQLKFQEQRSTNDLYFVYSALVRANKIAVIDEVLIHHRTDVSTSISMNRDKSWDCAYKALIKLKKQLEQWGLYNGKIKREYINYALSHSLWHLDTLKYPAQEKFYNKLRTKWLQEYGAYNCKKEFFYDDKIING